MDLPPIKWRDNSIVYTYIDHWRFAMALFNYNLSLFHDSCVKAGKPGQG